MIYDNVKRQIHTSLVNPGWAVIAVAGSKTEPGFAHTIGLWQNYQHPEIIVMALPPQTAQEILNQLGERVKSGEVIKLETPYDEIANHPVIFRAVKNTNSDYFRMAQNTYKTELFEAIQLVWSDQQGKFPWELGFQLNRHKQTGSSGSVVEIV